MLKKITLYAATFLGVLVLFNSCKKDYESIESIDDAKIQAYIKQKNLTMTKDPSGFYYQVISNGTGSPLVNKDSVFYTLAISSTSGTSYYNTVAYTNEGTYFGYLYPTPYRIALTGLNAGAKVRVVLPSYLAYGKNGSGSVPSNEIIVSEITTLPEKTQQKIDEKTITNFLAANNITAIRNLSGVYVKVITPGTGVSINIGSTVVVKYTGRLLNGTIFDQTLNDATYSYAASGGSIKGFDALLGMNAGAKVRLFIPSALAYGSTAYNGIPANSVLDFDVEIVSVN